ncbi:MAG: transposase [archaeon]|nr:transposase [archaeon]
MKVPVEIRKVKRPKKTVVVPYRSGTYAVRARYDELGEDGEKKVSYGQIVGYIIDGKYRSAVRSDRLATIGSVDCKQFGGVYLFNKVCSSILDELCGCFEPLDAQWIYCTALLRACYPGVKDCKLANRYRHSFLSEIHPGVTLGKNKNTQMFTLLGENQSRTERYMSSRVGTIGEDDIVIVDGSLKQDDCTDVSVSKVSRKTSREKVRHHLMMYAYGSRSEEPLCSKVYPGNVPDSVAIKDFVSSMEIRQGIIVADRGFKAENMAKVTGEFDGLHYLVPLTRDSDIISRTGALRFDNVMNHGGCRLTYRKVEEVGEDGEGTGTWLYAFNDPAISKDMAEVYYSSHNGEIAADVLEEENRWFGTIVFQSDLDLEPGFVYDTYSGRWDIECLFRMHRSDLELDDAREKSEATVMGSEFVNFVATLMASRMCKHLSGIAACKDMSYRSIVSDLNDCVKVRREDGSWEYRLTTKKDMRFYIATGVVTEPETMALFAEAPAENVQDGVKKRGRPKGSKDKGSRKRRSAAEIAAAGLK